MILYLDLIGVYRKIVKINGKHWQVLNNSGSDLVCRIYASNFNCTVFYFLASLTCTVMNEFPHVGIDNVLLRCCCYYTICMLLRGS